MHGHKLANRTRKTWRRESIDKEEARSGNREDKAKRQ